MVWNKGLKLGLNPKHSAYLKEQYASGKLVPWSKGLTKDNDIRLKKASEDASINPNYGMKGKHHTDLAIKKIKEHHAKSALGKHPSKNTLIKMRAARLGKTHSEKTKNLMSISHKGKIFSDEHRKNIGLGHKIYNQLNGHPLKNKTYEQIYGNEKAIEVLKKKSGQNHWNWQGGLSFQPYSGNFNKVFKKEIISRDGYLCLKCGMREEDNRKLFGCRMSIHHVDYNKSLTIKENCCSLCHRCNIEVNFNRKSWTKFFQSMLSERYGYKYENTEIIINLEKLNEKY